MKQHGVPVETPQITYMRTAIGTNYLDASQILRTYHALSTGHVIYSIETMRGAGRVGANLANTYCTSLLIDSMENVTASIHKILLLRSRSARIAVSMHNIPVQR